MSSFTDSVHGFSPYVKTLPVSEYTQVGIYKSQKLEEGISKVQQYVDTIAGLPIDKPSTREYVQTKLGQIKKALGDNISGDFSDQRLVSQIGGATSKIASDPIVVNGVAGTATLRSGMASIAEAKKSGKGYGVQNEAKFNEDASNWLNDGDPSTPFRSTYTPYVDVIGRALELYKAQNPGDNLPEGAFRYNADGKVEVNPTIINGVSAKRIQSVLDIVYQQPDVQQQLSIDGWYNFRGATPDTLAKSLAENTNRNLSSIEETGIALQLKLATDVTANSQEITKQLQELKEQAEAFKKEYSSNISLLETNPDALKVKIVKQGITSNFIEAYTTETLKKNPLWETQMEVAKFELDVSGEARMKEEFKYKKEKDSLDAFKAKESKEEGVFTAVGNVPESYGELGMDTFDKLVENKKVALDQGMLGLVFDVMNIQDLQSGQFNPVKKDPATQSYTLNVDPTGKNGYKTKEIADAEFRKIYETSRSEVMGGKARPELSEAFEKLDPIIRDARFYTEAKRGLDEEKKTLLEEQRKSSGTQNLDYIDAYIVKNKLSGWADSEKRLKNKYTSNWEVGLGIMGESKTRVVGGEVFFDTKTGPKEKEFKEFSKTFNVELAPKLQDLESKYRERQIAFKPLVSTIEANTPEEKERYRNRFYGMASSETRGNKAYPSFRKLLEPVKAGAQDENIYGAEYDRFSNKYYLTVSRSKGQPEKMDVSREEYESINSGLKTSNAFQDKYGSDLALTGNVTTDVPINGRPQGALTAYNVKMPQDSKYSVKYHVVKVGDNFTLKLYIGDKKGNLIMGPVGSGFNTSMDGIMTAAEQLKSDVLIEGIINSNK